MLYVELTVKGAATAYVDDTDANLLASLSVETGGLERRSWTYTNPPLGGVANWALDIGAWVRIIIRACVEPALSPTPLSVGCTRLFRGVVEAGREYTFVVYGYAQVWSSVEATINGQPYPPGVHNVPTGGTLVYSSAVNGDVDIYACGSPPTSTPTPSPCEVIFEGDVGEVGVFPVDSFIDLHRRGTLTISTTNWEQTTTYQPLLNAFLLDAAGDIVTRPESTRSIGVVLTFDDTRNATRLRVQTQFARWWIHVELCPLFHLTPTATRAAGVTPGAYQTATISHGGWGGPASGNTQAVFSAVPASRDCYVVIPPINFSLPLIGSGFNSPGLTLCVKWMRVTARVGSIDLWGIMVALMIGGILSSIWVLIRRG